MVLQHCIEIFSEGGKTVVESRELMSIIYGLYKRYTNHSFKKCYKIVLEIDSLHFSDFFELTKCNRTRANHDYKLYVKIAIVNCYKFSFFVRIVNMWNNLPKDIVHAGSLTLFRNRLKIYMNID